MTERSYPVANQSLAEGEWQIIGLTMGQGIVDQGGDPYNIASRSDVDNTITIGLDAGTGKNQAVIRGFVHEIDTTKVLSVPTVASDTTYEIGLVYDPALHGTTNGPISLSVWTAPGSTANGVVRLVLYRVLRKSGVALTSTTIESNRQRAVATMEVSTTADLGSAARYPVGTMAFVVATSLWHRVNISGGVRSWAQVGTSEDLVTQTEMTSHVDTRLGGYGNATAYETGSRVMARFSDGTSRVNHPKEFWDIVNLGTLNDKLSGKANSSHTHNAGDITSGTLNRNRADGMMSAYNNIQSGTHYTISVNSSGFFARYSSTKRHKRRIRPWDKDPRELLAVIPSIYDRIDPATGEVTRINEVGVVAEQGEEAGVTEFVQYGPDTVDEDGNPETDVLVQGWDYEQWTTAHQLLHRWHAERVDQLDRNQRIIAAKLGLTYDEAGNIIDDEEAGE